MQRHQYKYYRIIGVMFWAFPYLLWQALGNISGFFVGVVLALILTLMLNNLFRLINRNTAQLPIGAAEPQPHHQEEQLNVAERYQQGYQAETEPYQVQARKHQPQYEEMQVQYPQEVPPMPL